MYKRQALGGPIINYDIEKPGGSEDPSALDQVNAQFFQAFHAKRGRKQDGSVENFEKFKDHLRMPLVQLDLAAEYAQRHDL